MQPCRVVSQRVEGEYELWAYRSWLDQHSQVGPIAEYDSRIYDGKLRDDEHQRSKSLGPR